MSLFEDTDLIIEEAYQKALNLLDYAPQTEKNIFIKLTKKGYSKNIIKKVIKKLQENNLINDLEYAKIYADNLIKIKHTGPIKIIFKLKSKGIDNEQAIIITKDSVSANGGESEILKKYIKKNIQSIKKLLEKNQIEKIKLKLYNSGFSVSVINKITKNLIDIIKSLL